ncbi:type II toxin-antitoxin system VapC family toxin [Rhodohalobacter mucosus]|uniref:Ribonuclease VapC n=1 Tax=Rhodohalobacter mucosus TaxID=2079485 RepID=A0A316TRK6_9BACT|nr:type II toxin-antitoxin system VapC family toxin [Rhodohalobacter mucosus]PWN07050.1 PIN domain nuclease [Rhodohalobacter mucosus]
MILLDTHIWLWWLLGDVNLSEKERKVIDQKASTGELAISWVSVWEAEMLERKGRITLNPGFSEWIRAALATRAATLLIADTDVVIAQRELPDSFHTDPADRLIVATSILSGYPLATHDTRIADSGACNIWKP